jgi:hypothetical protein
VDPYTLSDHEVVKQVSEYLSQEETAPENGWSSQKITSCKPRWLKQADKEYATWEQQNAEALSIIYNSCSSVVKLNIQNETSAKSAWNTLQSLYSSSGFPTIVEAIDEVRSVSYNGCNQSLEHYVEKIRSLQVTFHDQGDPLSERVLSAIFLTGLPDQFNPIIREALDSQHQSLETLIVKAFNEERRFIRRPKNARSAPSSYEMKQQHHHRQQRPHSTESKQEQPSDSAKPMHVCNHCGGSGHRSKNCQKRGRSKQEHSPKQAQTVEKAKTSESGVSAAATSSLLGPNGWIATATTQTKDDIFLVDSGASHHLTNTMANYITFTDSKLEIEVADGRRITANGYAISYLIW